MVHRVVSRCATQRNAAQQAPELWHAHISCHHQPDSPNILALPVRKHVKSISTLLPKANVLLPPPPPAAAATPATAAAAPAAAAAGAARWLPAAGCWISQNECSMLIFRIPTTLT